MVVDALVIIFYRRLKKRIAVRMNHMSMILPLFSIKSSLSRWGIIIITIITPAAHHHHYHHHHHHHHHHRTCCTARMPLQAAMLSTTQPAVTRLTLVISFDMQIFQVFYILDIFCVICIFCIICMFHHQAKLTLTMSWWLRWLSWGWLWLRRWQRWWWQINIFDDKEDDNNDMDISQGRGGAREEFPGATRPVNKPMLNIVSAIQSAAFWWGRPLSASKLPYSADLYCSLWSLYLSAVFHNKSTMRNMKKYSWAIS